MFVNMRNSSCAVVLLWMSMFITIFARQIPVKEALAPSAPSSSTEPAAPPSSWVNSESVNMPSTPPASSTLSVPSAASQCKTTVTYDVSFDATYTSYLARSSITVSRVSCAAGCTVTAIRHNTGYGGRPTATVTTSVGRTITSFGCIATEAGPEVTPTQGSPSDVTGSTASQTTASGTTSSFMHGVPMMMPPSKQATTTTQAPKLKPKRDI